MSNKAKPRCPECGKALYRTAKPKQKRTTPLYPYCRNESCKLFGDIRAHGYNPGNDKLPGRPVKKRSKPSKPKTKLKTDVASKAKGRTPLGRKRKRKAVPAPGERKSPATKAAPLPLCEKCGKVIEKCICEHQAITSTRQTIGKAIADSKTRSITAMSVVVMLQELGDDDVANTLIDRYDLEKSYGLKKRGKK